MNAPFNHRRGIPVAWHDHARGGPTRVMVVERRMTIAEIVAEADWRHGLPPGFAEAGEVRIDGKRIERGVWHLMRPKLDPRAPYSIGLHVPMGDGRTLATVASIAVLIAATAIGGPAAGALGFTAGTFAFGAAAAGITATIGIGGSLAIAALIPPPSVSTQTAGAAKGPAEAANNTASLSGNMLNPGGPVPRALGTIRLFPPWLCQPLVELVDTDEIAEGVMGLNGPHALSVPRAAGVALSGISDATYELQEGLPESPIQSLVTRYGHTATPGIDLSQHKVDANAGGQLDGSYALADAIPQWHAVVSRDSPDEVWFTLSFGEGLFSQTTPTTAYNVPLRIRFRQRGSSTWIYAPEIHFAQKGTGAFKKDIRFIWGAIPASPSLPPTMNGPIYAFKHVPGQTGVNVVPASADYDADSYFSAGAGNDVLSASTIATSKVRNVELAKHKAVFYLDENTFPKDFYEFEVKRGLSYANPKFTASTYELQAVISSGGTSTEPFDLFGYYVVGSDKFSIPEDQSPLHATIALGRVASVINDNPIQTQDFATVSVKIKNRALNQISVLASGYTYDWDGSGWNTVTTTSNPAPHFRDILGGTLGATPLLPEIIDDDQIVDWRQHCIDQGYEVNAVVEGRTYQDCLTLCASAGFARLRHNETWGVFIDKDTSADDPVQVFTPRNMKNFKWTRAYANKPSGLRATFRNIDLDYEEDELIVYANDNDQDSGLLEEITYDGLVTTAEIETRATFDLLQPDLRFTFHQGESPHESIVCQRGDLVAVQYDVIARRAGFARIKSITRLAGNVTGLVLEGTVPVLTNVGIFATPHLFVVPHIFDLGAATGIGIRLKNNAGVLVKEIGAVSNGEVTTITFVTPFTDPGTAELDVDCLCTVGPLGEEYTRMKVFDITPDNDLGATITFVDEANELFAA